MAYRAHGPALQAADCGRMGIRRAHVGSPVLRSGDVAEIVADCWQDRLPQPGFENIASQSGEYDCPARMLKGGSAADDAKWRRASARRMLPHRAALVDVGFRVVRDE